MKWQQIWSLHPFNTPNMRSFYYYLLLYPFHSATWDKCNRFSSLVHFACTILKRYFFLLQNGYDKTLNMNCCIKTMRKETETQKEGKATKKSIRSKRLSEWNIWNLCISFGLCELWILTHAVFYALQSVTITHNPINCFLCQCSNLIYISQSIF